MSREVGQIAPLEIFDDRVNVIRAVNNRRPRTDPQDVVGRRPPGSGNDLHVWPVRKPALGLINCEDAPLLAREAAAQSGQQSSPFGVRQIGLARFLFPRKNSRQVRLGGLN